MTNLQPNTAPLTALIDQYTALVFSTARRIVGDSHVADDITQATFLVLVKKIDRVNPRTLPGWLVKTTRYTAREAVRKKLCRGRNEREAGVARLGVNRSAEEPTAEQLVPLLDEALARLNEADRTAVVLRFFQGRGFADIGTLTGCSEEAARKRVGRAVEKLRAIFMQRGIVASAGGVMVVLAAQQAAPAPAAVVAAITQGVAGNASPIATLLAKGVASMSIWSKALAIAAVGLIVTIGGAIVLDLGRSRPSALVATTRPSTQPATNASIPANDWLPFDVTPSTLPIDQAAMRKEIFESLRASEEKLKNIKLDCRYSSEVWNDKTNSWQYDGEAQLTAWLEGKPAGKYRLDKSHEVSRWINGARPFWVSKSISCWDGRTEQTAPFEPGGLSQIGPTRIGTYGTAWNYSIFGAGDIQHHALRLSAYFNSQIPMTLSRVRLNGIKVIKAEIHSPATFILYLDPTKSYALRGEENIFDDKKHGRLILSRAWVESLKEIAPGIFYPQRISRQWGVTPVSRTIFTIDPIAMNTPEITAETYEIDWPKDKAVWDQRTGERVFPGKTPVTQPTDTDGSITLDNGITLGPPAEGFAWKKESLPAYERYATMKGYEATDMSTTSQVDLLIDSKLAHTDAERAAFLKGAGTNASNALKMLGFITVQESSDTQPAGANRSTLEFAGTDAAGNRAVTKVICIFGKSSTYQVIAFAESDAKADALLRFVDRLHD